LLHVGPQSAGAVPGPACYGRGGSEPTVTDAAVVLGMLPVELAGGVELSRDRAEAALAPLAGRLGFDSAADVARGTLHIAAAAMADAIRSITVEQGRDPREAALVVFGGAGPLFGTLMADELDVDTIVIPALAGNFSAWGLLGADLAQTASRTRLIRLGNGAVPEVDALADELFAARDAKGCSARCTSTCATWARSTR
jgi:N-methylhydantoinase A